MSELEKLWQAQNALRAYKLARQRVKEETVLPRLKEVKKKLEEQLQKYKQHKQRLKRLGKKIKSKEMDCSALAERIKNFKAQLYDGRHNNPKELRNIEQQLALAEKELSGCEDTTLELSQEHEELTVMLEQLRFELKKEKDQYQEHVKEYEQWKEEINAEILRLKEKAEQLMSEVDPELVTIYKKKAKWLGDTVVARVENNTCGGCRIDISPVVIKAIKSKKQVTCENCGRLLFYKK